MSVPAERTWVVETVAVLAHEHDEFADYIPDPQAFALAMGELQAILTRIGGVATIATRRREISPGRTETLAVVIRWRSFVPLDKSAEVPPAEAGTAPPSPSEAADVPAEVIEEEAVATATIAANGAGPTG